MPTVVWSDLDLEHLGPVDALGSWLTVSSYHVHLIRYRCILMALSHVLFRHTRYHLPYTNHVGFVAKLPQGASATHAERTFVEHVGSSGCSSPVVVTWQHSLSFWVTNVIRVCWCHQMCAWSVRVFGLMILAKWCPLVYQDLGFSSRILNCGHC